jgi:hypothetical protein
MTSIPPVQSPPESRREPPVIAPPIQSDAGTSSTPAADSNGFWTHSVWTDGYAIKARNRALLPRRCIRCGSDHDIPMAPRQVAWAQPVLFLLLIIPGPIVGGLIIYFLQQHATLCIGICAGCRAWERQLTSTMIWYIALSGALFVGGVVAAITRIPLLPVIFWGFATAIFFAAILYRLFAGKMFSTTMIRNNWITLRGVSPILLRTLPQIPRP